MGTAVFWRRILLAVTVTVMVGCGGGGGGASSDDTNDTVNHVPVANAQSITVDEDIPGNAVTLSGTDADGDTLSYTVTVQPSHGTLSGTAPALTYKPAANYHGSDSFKFKVNDGTADSSEATVSITVNSVNDAPSASPQSVTTDEDTSRAITLSATDADGDTLSYAVTTQPSHGTLSGTAPALTYKPAANYHGSDSFQFKANDGTADSAEASVSITVNSVNDAPVANAQSITTNEETAKAVTLSGSDIDGDTLVYTVTVQPSHGKLTGTAPNLIYTSNTDYYGSDSFKFRVSDGTANSAEAAVNITVNNVNDTPAASDFTMTLDVNESTVTGDWSAASGASDGDGDTLGATVKTQGSYGSCVVTGSSISYLKSQETNATDSCTLTLSDGTATVDIGVTIVALYWKEVAAGAYHTAAVKSDGTLWSWGRNNEGALGNGTTVSSSVPVQESTHGSDWVSVSAGFHHTAAIKSDGTLWSWGYNIYGQLGNNSTANSSVPVQEASHGSDWISVSAGYYHTSAIKSGGTLWSWGLNGFGQLGNNSTTDSHVPVQESTHSTSWSSVCTGGDHTIAIRSDGTLWGWGCNTFGELGNNSTTESHIPVQESTHSTDWSSLSTGYGHTAAIKSSGTLWSWGRNDNGQLGDNSTTDSLVAVQEHSMSTDWVSISAGYYHTTAIKSSGTLWAWGNNSRGQLGDDSAVNSSVPVQEDTQSSDWSSVSGGAYHTAAIKTNGTLWSWGWSNYGQLGNGAVIGSLIPKQEVTESTWIMVSGGANHTAAIKSDHTLWCWGYNLYGQLGNNSTTDSYAPVQESTESTDWVGVDAGGVYTAAIKKDGTIWSWGRNDYGQLGNNLTGDSHVPVQEFTHSDNWMSLSAGYYHVAAIKIDGTLWSWGGNFSGQLGNNSTATSTVPVQEFSQSNEWMSLTAGGMHTVAIKQDGTLWAWGYNHYGQLGNNSTSDGYVPKQEYTQGIDWVSVGAGFYHTAAIRKNRTLWAWGYNACGQLGNNLTTDSHIPVQEFTQSGDWVSLSAGFLHTTAIKTDDTLWSWGCNDYGQLGNDSIVWSHVPVQEYIQSSDWASLSAGDTHTIAIRQDGTLWGWGRNDYGQLAIDLYMAPFLPVVRE